LATRLLVPHLGSLAQFEHAIIRERQREGIALAKKAGVYKGRKPTMTPDKVTVCRHGKQILLTSLTHPMIQSGQAAPDGRL